METAIQNYEGLGTQLSQYREPEQVLAEAQKAAAALTKVISMKKDPVKFNGEIYLEREDWGTVARFYNCTAKTVKTEFVQYGDVQGFEAVAVVVDVRTGAEIGRAESMCLNDEDNWGEVPVYDWVDDLDANGKKQWVPAKDGKKGYYKGHREQKGTKPKPLFQLRSMAQTRAEAKALRGVFSWVVVLAGYKPTPAEEMTGNEFDGHGEPQGGNKDPILTPQGKSQTQQNGNGQQQNGKVQQQNGNGQQQVVAVEVGGVIENTKTSNSGRLYLTLKGVDPSLVMVVPDKIDGDMKPDSFIKFRGRKVQNERLGVHWELDALIELTPVQDGDVPAEGQKLSPEDQKVAEEMFPDPVEGKAAVQGMVDSGTLKPASEVQSPKTIGTKRAQRIYALATQNKAKNNGFNEAAIKQILGILPNPLEHLSDLMVDMYEQFEKWATGADDWKAWLDS